MIFFQKNTISSHIQSFHVSISSGGHDNPTAFGPGSIINGSLLLRLDKPLTAYSIRVIFKCEESDNNKKITTIFNVESVIWGKAKIDGAESSDLAAGSHMYLFAIRLPHVNYPPSMNDYHFGHCFLYTIQGVLNLPSNDQYTNSVPVIYLPLITCPSQYIDQTSHTTDTFVLENGSLDVTAELVKPCYCPGDPCTLKMTTNNKSAYKINHVQLVLTAISTTLNPNAPASSDDMHVQKRHVLLTESFFVSIPKHTRDHHDIFRFHIPPNLVPSFINKLGRYVEIAYEITLSIPVVVTGNPSTSWFSTTTSINNVLSLPVPITTIPAGYPIEFDIEESGELPCFIPNIDTPLHSPSVTPEDYDYSVSPICSFQSNIEDVDDNFQLTHQDGSSLHDSTGHLLVPHGHRRKSNSSQSTNSTHSSNSTRNSAEIGIPEVRIGTVS